MSCKGESAPSSADSEYKFHTHLSVMTNNNVGICASPDVCEVAFIIELGLPYNSSLSVNGTQGNEHTLNEALKFIKHFMVGTLESLNKSSF